MWCTHWSELWVWTGFSAGWCVWRGSGRCSCSLCGHPEPWRWRSRGRRSPPWTLSYPEGLESFLRRAEEEEEEEVVSWNLSCDSAAASSWPHCSVISTLSHTLTHTVNHNLSAQTDSSCTVVNTAWGPVRSSVTETRVWHHDRTQWFSNYGVHDIWHIFLNRRWNQGTNITINK